MAYFGVTASEAGLRGAAGGELEAALGRRLAALPRHGPVVVLIHGYKFHPDRPDSDPHRSLFAFRPQHEGWRVRSWPEGLGFADDAGETGLCIGFAWPASAPQLGSLLASGRNAFAEVYLRAADYGGRLAELVGLLQRLAPGRPVDVLAHSLGARVALAALPHLRTAPERMVLLGAAEFDTRVRDWLAATPAPRPPQVYNVTARANDLYDALFETFAPRRSRSERAVGHGFAGGPAHWLDLQLDRAEVADWINAKGIALRPSGARLCHWSFYTRGGALDVYRAILRRRPGWDIASLRSAACFAAQDQRWSRLIPHRRARLAGLAPRLDPDPHPKGA